MKNYEIESLFKTFSILFITLIFFATIIAYLYYKEQKQILHNEILLEMKEFNYNFKSKKFHVDIVDILDGNKYFILNTKEKDNIYTLFPIQSLKNKALKVVYPMQRYKDNINSIKYKILVFYGISIMFFIFFSIFSAYYSIYPLRKALKILDEFFKDIIHDLNTPVTAILLNTKLLLRQNQNEEIEKIELSVKRISELYKNFEYTSNDFIKKYQELLSLEKIIIERVEYFKKIYPLIKFNFTLEKVEINLDKYSFIRIIDNLISNACKYNISNGDVSIVLDKNKLIISDSGIGIRDIHKVFERYYKETDRGIGIGMHIVKKLCDENKIRIKILSEIKKGTKIILYFPTNT